MLRKITSSVLAFGVLLLMQFADCQAMSADQHSMQCCRTMPCNPANRAHQCCNQIASSQVPSVLPSVHVPFSAPPAIASEAVAVPRIDYVAQTSWPRFDPPQHSPPDLYILYGSLLI